MGVAKDVSVTTPHPIFWYAAGPLSLASN